jgi:hypothetical protein
VARNWKTSTAMIRSKIIKARVFRPLGEFTYASEA